jgi:hypothetical protein
LELNQAEGDRRAEAEMLMKMCQLYVFNGRTQEGFAAIHQASSIIYELNLPPDDPLQPMGRLGSDTPVFAEQIPNPFHINLLGRFMGFGTKGKAQYILFFAVWFLLFIPAMLLAVPRMIVYWLSQRFAKPNA